jgi:SAM-dependent methyltransferase
MTRIVDRLQIAVAHARGFVGEHVLDRSRGIETSRPVDLDQLGLTAGKHIGYVPSGWRNLPSALRHVPHGDDDVFLDLGSGKGRIVIQAAQRSFKRVIGVELAPELTEAAERNVARYRGPIRAGSLRFVTADAATWPIPDDLTVAYLYSPVTGDVFATLWERLLESADRRPRSLRVVYNYPVEHEALIASGRVEVLSVASRSWPPRPDPDDAIVTYLVLPRQGRPAGAPRPDRSVSRHPAWRGRYDPGFHLEKPPSTRGVAPGAGEQP